jgi:pentatricopeptide repeat protein
MAFVLVTKPDMARKRCVYRRPRRLHCCTGQRYQQLEYAEQTFAVCRRAHSKRIARFAKIGDLAALRKAVEHAEADGVVFNFINYTAIAHGYAVAGQQDSVMQIFRTMRAKGARPSNATLAVAARGLRNLDWLMWTLQWFAAESGEPGDVMSWNKILHLIARDVEKDRDGRKMMQAFEFMRRGGVPGGPIPLPDTFSFNSVIDGWRRRQNVRSALAIYARMMLHPNATPDVVTYNSLLSLFLHNISRSETAYEDSLGLLNYIDALPQKLLDHNVQPDIIMHTLLLKVIVCQHKSPTVQKWGSSTTISSNISHSHRGSTLVRSIWRSLPARPDRSFYNTLIAAFGQVGDLQSALETLREMTKRHKIQPDLRTYNALIAAAARQGNDVDLVNHLFREVKRSDSFSPDEYTYCAAISAHAGDIEGCTKLLADAVESGVTCCPPMLNAALAAYGVDIDGALEQWRLWRLSKPYASAAGNLQVYHALLRVAGAAGRPDAALRVLFAGKRNHELEPSTNKGLFGSFMKGAREGGQVERLRSNFLMKQYTSHLRLECRAFTNKPELFVEKVRIRW